MNNEKEIMAMVKDFNDNKQYLKDIEESKNINRKVNTSLVKYKDSMQKIMEMVNVVKILDLGIVLKGRWDSDKDHIVLTNKGLKSRYITSNYVSQTQTLEVKEYSRVFKEAMKIIFNHPEISTVQKNKILPLKTLDVSFLGEVTTDNSLEVTNVSHLTTSMEIIKETLTIPKYNNRLGYDSMTNITLLSMRTQISPGLNEFLTERRTTIEKVETKTKELEALFPIIFLFGDS